MGVLERLNSGFFILDGGTGAVLQSMGLKAGTPPEMWNIERPENVRELHRRYYAAGSDMVMTNTFGVNGLKYSQSEIKKLVTAAVDCLLYARDAADKDPSLPHKERFAAFDIGPCGKLLRPFGELDFDRAVEAFIPAVKAAVDCGVDLITVETMNDCLEAKAAIVAAKEASSLPIIATTTYDASGRLLTGATPEVMVAMLEGLGVSALGVNCGLGPDALYDIIRRLYTCASVPVIAKPNAGLPRMENGATVFDVTPEDFAREMTKLTTLGARILGGCCGTTPEHIRHLSEAVKQCAPLPVTEKHDAVITSYSRCATIGAQRPLIIGERINPTGKKRLKQALRDYDTDYILSEALSQEAAGAQALDINAGLPELDEKTLLPKLIGEIQGVTALPLQIDTADFAAMEQAMRVYAGKPLVNSLDGKAESMDAVFPLIKKYGGVVVALTLDENGIPETAEGRLAIARRILARAADYGIDRKNILFDPLSMAVSADGAAARETLRALRLIRTELGANTSLGISNVSFGLPERAAVNACFFTLALDAGLSAAILNPMSKDMMRAYMSYLALTQRDERFEQYISYMTEGGAISAPQEKAAEDLSLADAIKKGLCARAGEVTVKLLENGVAAMEIIDGQLIPALDEIGRGFEKGTVFLPQLLISAEAAKAAFAEIKQRMEATGGTQEKKGTVVLATVQGDVHDIGKNIVRALLENYGYEVVDLGRDVTPEAIVSAVEESGAKLVGLSALMTTTVPAMEETIRLLRQRVPSCRVAVGGAVLTEEYAQMMHADFYGKDAMATVRCAAEVYGG